MMRWFQPLLLASIATPLCAQSELPDAPRATLLQTEQTVQDESVAKCYDGPLYGMPALQQVGESMRAAPAMEHYHWKGLLLQSLAFDGIQNGVRIAISSASDRHILVNKPFWHDYVASLEQFNMRRWNDGDSIKVNYVGHPLQGAITGYLEVQNGPSDRDVRFGDTPEYIHSRLRAFAWSTVYSTAWELLPIGEAGIFNEGGYTYPIRCSGAACNSPNATYTNNTGWVDFVITPILGTGLIVAEDYVDTITDRLVRRHPNAVRYKLLRAGANPSRSVANVLRGRYPWFRDYDSPREWESPIAPKFERALNREPNEHVDLFPHYTSLSIQTNRADCFGCRRYVSGSGVDIGIRLRRYLDIETDMNYVANASPLSSFNIGGDLVVTTFGLRSGFDGHRFAVKLTLAPGIASYSRAQSIPTASNPNPPVGRVTNFQADVSSATDVKANDHLALRITVENRLIRYKSPVSSPPGIGTPPNLSFLSHDNFINSTNWGIRMGPVLRF
jgi:hypothetical protein